MRPRHSAAGEPLDETSATISATVSALTAGQGLTAAEVARRIGMQKSTYSRRLHGGFTASDVAKLALALGVPVSDLYDGLGGRIKPPGASPIREYVSGIPRPGPLSHCVSLAA